MYLLAVVSGKWQQRGYVEHDLMTFVQRVKRASSSHITCKGNQPAKCNTWEDVQNGKNVILCTFNIQPTTIPFPAFKSDFIAQHTQKFIEILVAAFWSTTSMCGWLFIIKRDLEGERASQFRIGKKYTRSLGLTTTSVGNSFFHNRPHFFQLDWIFIG